MTQRSLSNFYCTCTIQLSVCTFSAQHVDTFFQKIFIISLFNSYVIFNFYTFIFMRIIIFSSKWFLAFRHIDNIFIYMNVLRFVYFSWTYNIQYWEFRWNFIYHRDSWWSARKHPCHMSSILYIGNRNCKQVQSV